MLLFDRERGVWFFFFIEVLKNELYVVLGLGLGGVFRYVFKIFRFKIVIFWGLFL